MAEKGSLIKIAKELKHKIADLDLFDELNSEDNPISSTPSDEEKKKNRKEAIQKRKQLAKVMARINKMSSKSGGGRAAGIGSALGRTPKSLLKNKLMPKT
mgnify:CR=1 FL=1|tara:strand:- start:711 stop:1010 length:300 start_codon:yes stop_codon:yes gene_type:complete